MTKTIIPKEIKQKINDIIGLFNKDELKNSEFQIVSELRGIFLYIDIQEAQDSLTHLCRLKFTGDMENWEFAVYRHSRDNYDSDVCLFPGNSYLDGSIIGAIKAGMVAYQYI
ncbi:MAG TPA: hypothetical protein PK874_07885 [Desulfobacteraceae bacterium]|nr:hypothetical protein [Desulfobacteraceae bacterium]HPJ66731.1 hypothetical protein [Desulfobacteraceae bacterium]HPQ26908.1 hypothetical protein [Desulfobacteraceae bacterium]